MLLLFVLLQGGSGCLTETHCVPQGDGPESGCPGVSSTTGTKKPQSRLVPFITVCFLDPGCGGLTSELVAKQESESVVDYLLDMLI